MLYIIGYDKERNPYFLKNKEGEPLETTSEMSATDAAEAELKQLQVFNQERRFDFMDSHKSIIKSVNVRVNISYDTVVKERKQ